MIGQIPTLDTTGAPLDNGGKKLTESKYQPPKEVKKLFQLFQKDYQNAWLLQRKPLDEFDGYSLLDRAKLDQQTFAAFVGVEYQPKHKRWRFKGRKNTSRNKIIGILAHLITGMLFPSINAQNQNDQDDKMVARVMRIMVEEWLKKANYEMKFLNLALSLLVNPACFGSIEFVQAFQKAKQKLKDGSVKIVDVVDELMSGLQLNIIPIDELLLGDLYTGLGDIQKQPQIFRVRRISYDYARKIYAGKHFDSNGKDLFDYVEAGKTKWLQETSENLTLFDIDWTEADGNFVQEVTGYYKDDDLEATWLGGIFMGNETDVWKSNEFTHRRSVLVDKNEIATVPAYPFFMSGFEPIDPAGRFVYYKSAAFKEYWDDQKLNTIDRLLVDGTHLEVRKPMFLSGVAKVDSTVIAPGATVGMPMGAKVEAYSLGPNLVAAYKVISDAEKDLSESTQDKIMSGVTEKGITATQTVVAQRQARIFLGVAGISVAWLVKQIGELTVDCVIQHGTIGELDASMPENLRMKYKTIIARGKEKGKNITNKIIFTDKMMGRKMSKEEVRNRKWNLFEKAGGEKTNEMIFEVNPFLFARHRYSVSVNADQMVQRSMGTDRQEKDLAFGKMTDPRVMPFVDMEAVVQDFVIDEYGTGDPDRYKKKGDQIEMMNALAGLTKTKTAMPERMETAIA